MRKKTNYVQKTANTNSKFRPLWYSYLTVSGIYKIRVSHGGSHGEDGSRPQGPLYPRNNTKIIDYWWSGVVVSALASINEVNQRRARLVLRCVTVSWFNSRWGTFISVCDQPPRSTQPGHPFVGRRNEYHHRAVMPCGWGVKAGMVRVWVAGKTVWSPCYTRAISERFRDKERIYKALYKFAYFSFFTIQHSE